MISNSVRTATRADLPGLVAIMNNGFLQDPYVRWVLPDDDDFERAHSRYVEIVADPAFDHGAIHMSSDGAAAAVWHPPGVVTDGDELMKLVSQFPHLENIEPHLAVTDACGAYMPEEPHWVLELLAVDDAKRGQGIGADLLVHGLAICDRTGGPVYLESTNPANLSLYRRHGFDLLGEVALAGTPKRYPMIRRG